MLIELVVGLLIILLSVKKEIFLLVMSTAIREKLSPTRWKLGGCCWMEKLEAKLGMIVDSIGNFFSGKDQLPLCDPGNFF